MFVWTVCNVKNFEHNSEQNVVRGNSFDLDAKIDLKDRRQVDLDGKIVPKGRQKGGLDGKIDLKGRWKVDLDRKIGLRSSEGRYGRKDRSPRSSVGQGRSARARAEAVKVR